MASISDQHNMRLENYPGGFSPVHSHMYVFPEVKYYDALGKVISTSIRVCGAAGNPLQASTSNPAYCPISPDVFDSDPPFDFYCLLFVVTKKVNESVKPPTLITRGKNLDKINRTTIFRQALSEGYSHYKNLVKNDRRFVPDSPHLLDLKVNGVNLIMQQCRGMIPPMLLTNDDPAKWFQEHFPRVVIQPKFDGVRATYVYTRIDGEDKFIGYTRRMALLPGKNFTSEIERMTKDYPGLYFDGEIYQHGMSLQAISGSARNTGKHTKTFINCDFMIFDVFKVDDGKIVAEPYIDRYLRYEEIRQRYANAGVVFQFIRFVRLIQPKSYEGLVQTYNECVADGYEGLVLKDAGGFYEPSYNSHRSSNGCKMKQRMSAEFKCIGWKSGEGKCMGMLAAWRVRIIRSTKSGIAKVDEKLAKSTGVEFYCTPKATDVDKRAWYDMIQTSGFDQYACLCTVEFFDVSDDGVPTQPVWIAFRDYEESVIASDDLANDN
jgi:ATP-dependent DNA ligase